MPKSTLETTQPCPSCDSPVEEHLDFCHRCGETVARAFRRTASGRPSLAFMAAVVLALCFAVILAVTLMDFFHQYGVPGGADVSQRAERYLLQGQDDSAINLLEESLQVKADDKRAPEWHLMLDRALYARGKKLGADGKFRDAVTCLARISTTFENHEDVDKLIAEYSDKGLKAVFGKQEEGDSGEREIKPLSKMEKAVMTAVPGGKNRSNLPLPLSLPAGHL